MKRPGFLGCALGILFLFSHRLLAQNPSPPFQTGAAYLLPQTIFVGDAGRLVVPLGPVFASIEPFVLETPGKLPETPDLVIRRIELERRGAGARLLIDFIPYAPGNLAFPPLELYSLSGASAGTRPMDRYCLRALRRRSLPSLALRRWPFLSLPLPLRFRGRIFWFMEPLSWFWLFFSWGLKAVFGAGVILGIFGNICAAGIFCGA